MKSVSTPRPDSRTRILAAAAREFAAHGFDGANMDRLARAARLNKAMIYYHFRGKAALYSAIFREFIRAILDHVRAVDESDAPPADKIRAFVRAIAAEAQLRPHFPPMWLREIAGGSRHVDQATVGLFAQIPATLARIVAEGVATGEFRPVHPLLLHFGIVGPLILYYVSEPIRARLGRTSFGVVPPIAPDAVLEQIVNATLAALEPVRPAPAALSRQGRRS
jgi:TetR/AcrR family transcriptional regulator